MSSTYSEFKVSNNIDWFRGRITHNNRQKNLSDSDFKDDEFLNIVEVVNADAHKIPEQHDIINCSAGTYSENLRNYLAKNHNVNLPSNLKRSDVSKKASAYTSKISKLNSELETLTKKMTNCIENGKHDSNEYKKLNNKYNRKKNTIEKNQDILNHLMELKENTQAKKIKNPNKKKFVEMKFSITLMKKYRRDIEYRDEFYSMIKEFLELKGFTMDIHSISIHCDQSVIHCHLLGVYNQDTTLNQDLERIYGKKFNYFDFQKDFNEFVANHEIVKKRGVEIEGITKGGKKDYVNLKAYKEIQVNSQKEVKQYIYNLKNKFKAMLGLDKDSYIKSLEKKLYSTLVDLKTNKYISKKLESEHKKMEDALDRLKVDATTLNALSNNVEVLKSKMTNILKEKEFYKQKFDAAIVENDKLKSILENTNTKKSSIDFEDR